MMLDNYNGETPPGTFAIVEYSFGYGNTTWLDARATYYGVEYTPTVWFDGATEIIDAITTEDAYDDYHGAYNTRLAAPTDVTIELNASQVTEQTYRVKAKVAIEAGGTAKTMRIYLIQVLDNWPNPPTHTPRYGFVQAAKAHGAEDQVTVAPGNYATVTHDFTFTGDSWENQDDIKIVAWAAPQSTANKVSYQAATLHWPFTILGDLNGDRIVDLNDVAAWALALTNRPQFESQYPDVDADFVGDTNEDDAFNGADAYTFVNLLISDQTPPTPDPMSFASGGAPVPISTTAITMTATEASDAAGVEYYFTAGGSGSHHSGWQSSTTYTDSGLQVNRNYNYKVRARDLSPQHNETADCTAIFVATMIETPTNLVTGTVNSSSIQVTAEPTFTRLASAQSGVWFEVTDMASNPVGGAQANAWVKLQTITASGLSPNTTYRFRVRAKNYYGYNITPWYPESGYVEIATAP